MIEIDNEDIVESGSGYKSIVDDDKNNIYNYEKFNYYFNKLYIVTNEIPNMDEFKKISKKDQNYIIRTQVFKNIHEITHELYRLLNINNSFVTTKYFQDLFKLYKIYYKILY